MLFPYQYVPHRMERMQEFIDFIFNEVWCKAPIGLEFHPDLFETKPKLKEVMAVFGFSAHAPERGKEFYRDVKAIYQLFASLSAQEIDQFKQWYQGNNDIEKICANDPSVKLVRYADIPVAHKSLCDPLALFFKGLYSQSLLDLAVLRAQIGEIDDHYKAFMSVNNTGKCPFCGIADMQGSYHSTREAYDHYLPKGLYPFNSINFHNLVPACHHCNSSYKASKDPAYTPKDPVGAVHRRKVFYPYTSAAYSIDIKVNLNLADIDQLKPTDIQLEFGPAVLGEQIETWKDVYGIEERYRGKLLNGDGKAWLVEVFDEWRWNDESAGKDGRNPAEYLKNLTRHTTRSPYVNSNFLKKSFLEGCHRIGIF